MLDHHDISGATQLGGADAGLFDFNEVELTQGQRIKVYSLRAHAAGTAPTWTLSLEDPIDQAKSVILLTKASVSDADFGSFYVPAYGGSNGDGKPWRLKLVTTGKDAAAWVECSWGVE